MTRPRLLLVPNLTQIEWLTRPEFEKWAEVASFDAPGVGGEPPAESFGREAMARRGLVEIERRGWESYIVVSDGSAIPTAVRIVHARPDAVEAVALGHARLSNAMEGERAPMNRAVFEALGQLLQSDYGNFVRYGLTQATHGSIGDELAKRMIERIPGDVARATWEMIGREREPFGDMLKVVDVPLLFAKHEGCLGMTDEGFEDAVAAFPQARTISVPEAPIVSSDFARVLRDFCEEVSATSAARSRMEA